ncbi:glutamate-1-semialdehyde 2,1-aminomutase [soil metagenome]
MQSSSGIDINSEMIIQKSARYIAGGVASVNRMVKPHIVFEKAKGSKIYDIDGKEYIDYHAAFGPFLLGHNFDLVNRAVTDAMQHELSLTGSGTNGSEARLAELLCENIPSLELVQIANTGSEATAHAIRVSRAFTGREDIVLVLGGYNGWHNEVAREVMPSLEQIKDRIVCGEYPFLAASAGIPEDTKKKVHIINFNDLESLEYVLRKYAVACVLTEPVLQNIGVVLPQPGYLENLYKLCEDYGAVCIFDEVKTGFRCGLGGYQSVCNVTPHLSVFAKAIANGFPLAAIGGKKEIMELFGTNDHSKRVLLAGTYNAHPFNAAAAIATIEFLEEEGVYQSINKTSELLYQHLYELFEEKGLETVINSNASAFCVYFCRQQPQDLHDILYNHNFELDKKYRKELIKRGIYHIPIPCKQGSVSFSHTEEDIFKTIEVTREVLKII